MGKLSKLIQAGKTASPTLFAVSFAGLAITLVGAVLMNLFEDVKAE